MQKSFEITKKQAEYIKKANHRWNVACGAVRSGKSYCQISYVIPSRILERAERKGLKLILGATRDNIERNVLEPMRNIYGENLVSGINNKNTATLFGCKVYCIGGDNVRQIPKIRGSEIAYCAIDEATDLSEPLFDLLKSRLSLPYSCCDITTNPASPNHWFKAFLDSAEKGVDIYVQNYTIYDNPFLPADYVKNLEAEYSGTVWYDRYILGLWTLAEGLVFPNFAKTFQDYKVLKSVKPTEFCISLDYGTSNPFAAMLWSKRGGVWLGENNLYYSGRETGVQKTDEEYMEMLVKFAEPAIGFYQNQEHEYRSLEGDSYRATERVPVIVDPSAASFIALLRQSEYFRPIPANNEVINGIRDMNTAINRGVFKIDPICEHWKNEAQSYVWDSTSTEDRPIKQFDHLMDATRYFVNTKRLVNSINEYSSMFGG